MTPFNFDQTRYSWSYLKPIGFRMWPTARARKKLIQNDQNQPVQQIGPSYWLKKRTNLTRWEICRTTKSDADDGERLANSAQVVGWTRTEPKERFECLIDFAAASTSLSVKNTRAQVSIVGLMNGDWKSGNRIGLEVIWRQLDSSSRV